MKVTTEKTENRQAFLTIEVEPEEVEKSKEKAYQRLVQKTRVPGFRKGKAPRAVLERRVGQEAVFDEALDVLIPEVYEKALDEQKIEAYARPTIEVAQTEPLVLKAVVPLHPTVKLGDYRSIRVTPETVEIKDEDIDAVIEQLRHQHATWEPVERPVEFGDLVALDVASNLEGRPFINREGMQYQPVSGSRFPAPGFPEQLVGMNKGDEKEFDLQYPEEFGRPELASKNVHFKVKVVEVKKEVLPELNDDFASSLGEAIETVTGLRERVKANLKANAEEKAEHNLEEKAIESLVEVSEIEYPPVIVESEINSVIRDRFQKREDLDAYLKYNNKTEEQFRDDMRPAVEKRVKATLSLGELAISEKIEVSDSEVDAEVAAAKEQMKDKSEELRTMDSPEFRDYMKHRVYTHKTVERLAAIARGEGEAAQTVETAETVEKEEAK